MHTTLGANGNATFCFRVRMPSIGAEDTFAVDLTVDGDIDAAERRAHDMAMAKVGAVAERLMREVS